jgi:hypothetical protein
MFLEQVFALRRGALPQSSRHFKVFGENHSMSSHIMAQTCAVSSHPGTVFCTERPANALALSAHMNYGLPYMNLPPKNLQETDPSGDLYARSIISSNAFRAGLARSQRLAAALRGGGAIACVDALKDTNEDYLRAADKLAVDVAVERFKRKKIDLDRLPSHTCTPERDNRGLIVRNHVMARRIFNAAVLHGAGEIVIGTGMAHLGNKIENVNYADSVPCALAEYAGQHNPKTPVAVTSVFFSSVLGGYMPNRIIPPGRHENHIPVIVHGSSEKMHGGIHCQNFEGQIVKKTDELGSQRNFINRLRESFEKNGQTGHPAYGAFLPYDGNFNETFEQIRPQLSKALGTAHTDCLSKAYRGNRFFPPL